MAYDENLADRIRNTFKDASILYIERKMFGGLCFMVNDKMCVGIVKEELMARVGEGAYRECLSKEHCREMDFSKRPMKGYVFVSPEGIDTANDLAFYIKKAIDFNPLAKASIKRKK